MIVVRSMHRSWLSNTYLLADSTGGRAVLIDSGGPVEPIVESVERNGLTVSHILCTHNHHDHTANNEYYKKRFGCMIAGHAEEGIPSLDAELANNDTILCGGVDVRALHVPGHTRGQLSFLARDHEGASLFTGDTLFRESVGGTCGPGHTTFEDIRHSIMNVLMTLPRGTKVYPGHTDETSIKHEWRANPFIRAWRGRDKILEQPCLAFGRPATLLLRAKDYDGGTKCWIRFDSGEDDIVPGSRVESATP